MQDKEENEPNGNLHIDKGSVSCNLCRCGRKSFHKGTRTTTDKEGNKVVNEIEERSSWRVGGRGVTPDGNKIFETSNKEDKEDIDTVSTGWGSRLPTPPELVDRVGKLEKELEELKNKIA